MAKDSSLVDPMLIDDQHLIAHSNVGPSCITA